MTTNNIVVCRWKVHPQCKEKIGDSCGLTPAYLKEALKEMFMKDTGNVSLFVQALLFFVPSKTNVHSSTRST